MNVQPRSAVPLVLAFCLALAPAAGAQDRDSIPQALRQPQRGEAPRYPRDTVIGSLERGDVPEAARRLAFQVMAALTAGNRDAPALSPLGPQARSELFSALEEAAPRTYRVGEGREEADGSCSFLVRFLGRELGIAGELYLRPEEVQGENAGAGTWRLDDLLLEEAHSLGEIADEPLFDLPPYERLY